MPRLSFKTILWWAFLAAVAGVIGTVATNSVESAVENTVIRDIAVPVMWLAVILGLPWVVTLNRPFSGPAPRPQSDPHPDHGPDGLPAVVSGEFLAQVTGDSVIRDVLGEWCPIPQAQIWDYDNLTLAEMALLRRMSILPGHATEVHECEAVLIAAGVASPRASLVRLRGQEMFSPSTADVRVLSEKGVSAASNFTLCLGWDAKLVAAYRKVTRRIDETIRFDGVPLLSRSDEEELGC